MLLKTMQYMINNIISTITYLNEKYNDWFIIMITAHQLHKYSVSLFTQLQNTDTYQELKNCLYQWRDSSKNAIHTIIAFQKIIHIITTQIPSLQEDLNRCIVKDYHIAQSDPSIDKIKKLALQNPNSLVILQQIFNWLKVEQPAVTPVAQPTIIPQLQQLSQQQFTQRLQKHERSSEIAKIINLYRRCVITVGEFKALLEPIYLSDPSFFNMLFQYAQELQFKRRKITIFAPLTELVDHKYPLEQVGNSYIIIPDGYANWGSKWSTNLLQNTLNRICVSVPLGTEGSFIITRKNQFQEQLLRNQQEKYEIDSNLASLEAVIKIIQKTKKLTHPLVQKILSFIYTGQIMNLMMKNPQPQIAKSIILPRLKQKLMELHRCRAKFQRTCEQITAKNFYKSLDYRCFYFCKNDKKFNCPTRWEKQIQLRKQQVIKQHRQGYVLQIEDRDSLQHSRYYVLNSFDNITTQQILPQKRVDIMNNKVNQTYPNYPHNQVLFLLDFADKDILNDVFQILLFHIQKKPLLQLMIFKIMRINIQRKMQKDSAIVAFIDGKIIQNSSTTQLLNQIKTNRRIYKDLTDQFLELIQEDIDPAKVEELPFPFQGPQNFTFLGTKQCYFFLRYLLTIYQRFLRAKNLSDERKAEKIQKSNLQGSKYKQPGLYDQFLAVLIYKLKQPKGLQEYLRKIYQQDAFIFFTLDKLIVGVVKMFNNINVDSLTYKVLKDGVRDYDMQIRRWQDYPHPTVTQQLTKLCRENQTLFRFSYNQNDKLVYISAWQNDIISEDRKKKQSEDEGQKNIINFLNDPIKQKLKYDRRECFQQSNNEYIRNNNGSLIMEGEQILIFKRKGVDDMKMWQCELSRLKKFAKK